MIIYRLDDQIEKALAESYDPDTGELLEGVTEESLTEKLKEIHENFDITLDSITSEVKNLKAEAEAVKAEKLRLGERQKSCENRAESLKRLLAYLLKGEKWQNDHHKISYRTSESAVVDDQFVEWASACAPGLLKIEPEPRLLDIKNAIKNGAYFEHAHLEKKSNIQIK